MKQIILNSLGLLILFLLPECTEDRVITNEIPDPMRQIEYFAFEEFNSVAEGMINSDSGIINVTVPFGANIANLTPTIEVSDNATISPASGLAQDFSDFVVYTVTDPEDRVRLYTVLVEIEKAPKSNEAKITYAEFAGLFREGEINEESKEVTLEVGFGTDLTNVQVALKFSEEEAFIPSAITDGIDLTSDYIVPVTAPDGTTVVNYTIKATVLPQETGIRGVWLTNVDSNVLSSQAGIEEAVQVCADLNINTIFVVTYNKATTTYPSQVMEDLTGTRIASQYVSRDPLRELIDAAHAKNIKVIGWFEYGFTAMNGSPGPILEAKPEWAAINSNGEQVVKNGFWWLNSLLPEVQGFMNDLILEVVNNYPDIDGIQGDDRLPAMPSEAGYDDYTKSEYAAEHEGAEPPANRLDPEWLQWRANRLNDYARDLYQQVKAANPNCIVAQSPSPLNFGYTEYLQDYSEWVKGGYADIISPQLYRRDNQGMAVYRSLLTDQISFVGQENKDDFYPGVLSYLGSYVPEEQFLADMILENRAQGITGEVHFFYNALLVRQDVFRAMYPGPAIFPDL